MTPRIVPLTTIFSLSEISKTSKNATNKIANSENVNEAKDRRVIMDHSDFLLSRAHMWCRSHVPSIPEKPSKASYEGPRRTSVVEGERNPAGWIRRASALDICNSKSLPPLRIEGQAMVRDVCNSISLCRPGSVSVAKRLSPFFFLRQLRFRFQKTQGRAVREVSNDSMDRDKGRRGSLEKEAADREWRKRENPERFQKRRKGGCATGGYKNRANVERWHSFYQTNFININNVSIN